MAGTKIEQIKVDGKSPLFDKSGMFSREFPSDLKQLKFFSSVIMQKVPIEIKERNFLEKQITELLKNAIIHGNRGDQSKKVKAYYSFTPGKARLIIEDQGEGFKEIEEWNSFYKKRCHCFEAQIFDELEQYTSFKTEKSTKEDNGNALFQAVKFWNGGIVFNTQRNSVAVLKIYPQKGSRINII